MAPRFRVTRPPSLACGGSSEPAAGRRLSVCDKRVSIQVLAVSQEHTASHCRRTWAWCTGLRLRRHPTLLACVEALHHSPREVSAFALQLHL